MDSPTELSALTLRAFNLGQDFRVAVHHDASDAVASRFAAALERVVREERAVFGELPAFEAPYTFIADFRRTPVTTAWNTGTARSSPVRRRR